MDYESKYLKYKNKYLELKEKLELEGGARRDVGGGARRDVGGGDRHDADDGRRDVGGRDRRDVGGRDAVDDRGRDRRDAAADDGDGRGAHDRNIVREVDMEINGVATRVKIIDGPGGGHSNNLFSMVHDSLVYTPRGHERKCATESKIFQALDSSQEMADIVISDYKKRKTNIGMYIIGEGRIHAVFNYLLESGKLPIDGQFLALCEVDPLVMDFLYDLDYYVLDGYSDIRWRDGSVHDNPDQGGYALVTSKPIILRSKSPIRVPYYKDNGEIETPIKGFLFRTDEYDDIVVCKIKADSSYSIILDKELEYLMIIIGLPIRHERVERIRASLETKCMNDIFIFLVQCIFNLRRSITIVGDFNLEILNMEIIIQLLEELFDSESQRLVITIEAYANNKDYIIKVEYSIDTTTFETFETIDTLRSERNMRVADAIRSKRDMLVAKARQFKSYDEERAFCIEEERYKCRIKRDTLAISKGFKSYDDELTDRIRQAQARARAQAHARAFYRAGVADVADDRRAGGAVSGNERPASGRDSDGGGKY